MLCWRTRIGYVPKLATTQGDTLCQYVPTRSRRRGSRRRSQTANGNHPRVPYLAPLSLSPQGCELSPFRLSSSVRYDLDWLGRDVRLATSTEPDASRVESSST